MALTELPHSAKNNKANHVAQSIWVGAGSMKSSGMCTLVTLRGRYARLARSFFGSGALLRGPERGAGVMPALFNSAPSKSGSWGICMCIRCVAHAANYF